MIEQNRLELNRNFIEEKVEDGKIYMPFIPTSQQRADISVGDIKAPV